MDDRARASTAADGSMEEFLRGTPLFRGAEAAVVARVAPHAEALDFAAGETILRVGAPSNGIVILRAGRASAMLVHASTGTTTTLEVLQPGQHAGELSVLLQAAQPHAVVADTACKVVRLRAEVVEALANKVPTFALALARRLAMRAVQLGVTALRGPANDAAPAARDTPARAAAPRGIAFAEVAEYDPPAKVIAMVPPKLVLTHRMLPLRLQGNALTLGMVNPRNATALADLQRVLHNVDVEVVAIGVDDYMGSLVRYRIEAPSKGVDGRSVSPDALTFDVTDSEREPDKQLRVVGDEVVRALNKIIAAGIAREASDIHIEPDATGVRVRYRVSGVLHDSPDTVPASFARGLVARVKILAGLDITDRRMPQDGRIGMSVGPRELDLRVSTMPTGRGEKVVLRLLEGGGMQRPLEQVFVEPGLLAVARRAVQRPHGGVLIAGGTGSGKSSTLYAMIHERRKARPDSSVIMVEDPIEYRLSGVTQVQVNAGIGLGFPQVLRATLRQDPDVIAVGETRDRETALMALEAAMTGHLLLTSLHANDVTSALQRLESLGCGRTLVAQSVAVILVQRLVRRLCGQCVRVEAPPSAIVESLVARRLLERGAPAALPRAVGCDACQGTGHAGRVLVVESMYVNDATRDALMADQGLGEIVRVASSAGAFQPFASYAAQLMARRMISASEALLAVAD